MAFAFLGHWFPMNDEEATNVDDIKAIIGENYAYIDTNNAARFEWRAKSFDWSLDITNPDPAYVISETGTIDPRSSLTTTDDLVAEIVAVGTPLFRFKVDEVRSVGGTVVFTPMISPGDPGYQTGSNIRVRILFYVGQWAQPADDLTVGSYSDDLDSDQYALMRDDAVVGSERFFVPIGATIKVVMDITTVGSPSAPDTLVSTFTTNALGTVDPDTRMSFGDGIDSDYGFSIPLSEPATGFSAQLNIAADTNLTLSP